MVLTHVINGSIKIGTLFGVIGFSLDLLFYYQQPRIYEQLYRWWCVVYELKLSTLNSRVVLWIANVDSAIFGDALLSKKSMARQFLLFGLIIMFEYLKSFFTVAPFEMSAISILTFLSILPALLGFYIARSCVRFAAQNASPLRTLAGTCLNLLCILLLGIVISLTVSFYAVGILHLSVTRNLNRFETIDLFELIEPFSIISSICLYQIALAPCYIYLLAASFLFVCYAIAKISERILVNEWYAMRYKAFTACGVMLAAIIGFVTPIIYAGLKKSDEGFTSISTAFQMRMTNNLTLIHLSRNKPDYRTKFSIASNTLGADYAALSNDERTHCGQTGLFMTMRFVSGNFDAGQPPEGRFYGDLRDCWVSRNSRQNLQIIDDRLSREPNDLWALYAKACYYSFVDKDSIKAKEAINKFLKTILKTGYDPDILEIGTQDIEPLSNESISPETLTDSVVNLLHANLQNFPGNDRGLVLWCLQHPDKIPKPKSK